MAANEYTLNHNALEDILKSEKVTELMRKIAQNVVDATPSPGDYKIEEYLGSNRARVSIVTVGFPAHAREARDHHLVQALAEVRSSG